MMELLLCIHNLYILTITGLAQDPSNFKRLAME